MTARFDRRTLIAGGVAASVAGLAPLDSALGQRRRVSANDKLQVGLIGCKGMGWANLTAMMKGADVVPVALCDIDARVLTERGAELRKMTGRAPRLYDDYRRMLDDRTVDAVIIATPDHWHALQLIDAMSAGKDAYCEKPLGNSIAECRAMVAAKQRHGRVVQVGQWQRSNQHWADAIALVQSGGIGRVRKVKAWAYMGWMKRVEPKPDQPAPAGVERGVIDPAIGQAMAERKRSGVRRAAIMRLERLQRTGRIGPTGRFMRVIIG